MSISVWSFGVESLAVEPIASGAAPAVKVIVAGLLNRKIVMAQRAVGMTVEFLAWDTVANAPKTGDSANITPRWTKDGTIAALGTTTVTELDSTNAPGQYKVTLSSTETDCYVGTLHGKSATSGVYVMPVEIGFVYTPNAAPGAANGMLIAGSNAGTTTFGAITCTGTLTISDGLAIARSSANTSAITATGNGTGSGAVFSSGAGATGDGIQITAASTNGNGMVLTKTGSGLALKGATTDLTLGKTTNITGFNDLTAAAIATGVWQDTTAGDFTTAGSIGKSLFTSGNAPGAASGIALVGSNMGSASSVTAGVTVTTNNDKTGYALTAGERTSIADALLGRNVAGGSSTGRLVSDCYAFLRNKWVISGGTLTVYATDDSTPLWTAVVTGTAGADPVTGTDPA